MISVDDVGDARGRTQSSALICALTLAVLCATPPAAADEGGPDEFGYGWIDSDQPDGPIYSLDFSPSTSAAQPFVLDDDSAVTISIGFTFEFYGQQYNQLHVHSNGGITFGPDASPLPHGFWYQGSPNTSANTNRDCDGLTWTVPTIAGYWTDLNPNPTEGLDGDGGVYSSLYGTPGQRRRVVSWYQIPHYNSQGKNQFEIKLFEEDDHIEFHYAVLAGGTSFGGGLSSAIGTGGLDHELLRSCGENVLSNNSAISISSQPCNDTDFDGACSWEDCDNDNSAVFPGAEESCNDIDDDCDNEIDESPASGETTWYPDLDGDGYGTSAVSVPINSCHAPDGYAATNDDCDDGDNDIFPGAPELCDGLDNDCDPSTEESVDEDGDGSSPCGNPADCDDSNATLNPNDLDGDGISSCNGDCNDTVESIHPGAGEICDGFDNDCDERIDENPNCDDAPIPGSDIPYGCILDCSVSGGDASATPGAALLGLLLGVLAMLRRRRPENMR